jgi:hypothetical protein
MRRQDVFLNQFRFLPYPCLCPNEKQSSIASPSAGHSGTGTGTWETDTLGREGTRVELCVPIGRAFP